MNREVRYSHKIKERYKDRISTYLSLSREAIVFCGLALENSHVSSTVFHCFKQLQGISQDFHFLKERLQCHTMTTACRMVSVCVCVCKYNLP